MTRWEYCYLTARIRLSGFQVRYLSPERKDENVEDFEDLDHAVSSLGNEGWEAFSVFEGTWYFKRPLDL